MFQPLKMTDSKVKTSIVGLSGPSSSGKTTLARILREIFNATTPNGLLVKLFIVHEDDFYKTDVDVPWRTWTSPEHGERRLQDWDCVESLDLPLIRRVTDHIKAHGELPADFASKEDQNSVGDTHIRESEIASHRDAIYSWLRRRSVSSRESSDIREIRICIVEGFLLFPAPMSPLQSEHIPAAATTSSALLQELSDILAPNLDLKIFLPCTKELTVSRRARRSGYVTLEGFWEDPPGYVEELVWPNYVRDHRWLFANPEDADLGNVDMNRAQREHVLVGPGRGDQGMKMVLDWGVETLQKHLEVILH